jgi:hypothetical protein
MINSTKKKWRIKQMKNGKCKYCNRIHSDSIIDGFGGHVKGFGGSVGKYFFICLWHIVSYSIDHYSILGTMQKWTTELICKIHINLTNKMDAVSLAMQGWQITTLEVNDKPIQYIATRECYSLQGLDKMLKRIDKKSLISFFSSYNILLGMKNNKRTYNTICFQYVKTMHEMNSPYLKHWNIDTASEYLELINKSGKNCGIAQFMDNRTMSDYIESMQG